MQRTIVGLRNKNGKFTIPKFSDCLLEFFGKDINSVTVSWSLENGIFVLTESDEGHELRHSPDCPIKLNADFLNLSNDHNQNSKLINENIKLAASVIIESSDSHVLLTKRSAHMRASPNVWVLPGGHLEIDETIFQAGTREVNEETGLEISLEKETILGFWENVYPLLIGLGTPKYHVLVVYLYACLNETYKELTNKIVLDPEEVSSFCWVNEIILENLFSADKNVTCEGKQYVTENGKIIEKYLDYCSMFNKHLRVQSEPYSGVNYGLRKWLEKKASKKINSKY